MTRTRVLACNGSLLLAALLSLLPGNPAASAPLPKDIPRLGIKFADKVAIPDIAIEAFAFLDEARVVVVGTKSDKGLFEETEEYVDPNKLEPNGAILDLAKKTHTPFTNGHKARIGSVSVVGNRIATCSNALDPTVRIWDLKKGETITEIKIEEPEEGCHRYGVAYFHKSDRIAIAAQKNVILLDPAKPADRIELDIPGNIKGWADEKIVISPDDTWIAARWGKEGIAFWWVATKKATAISLTPENVESEEQWRSLGVGFGHDNTLMAWRCNSSGEVPENALEANIEADRRGIVRIDTANKKMIQLKMGHGVHTMACAIDSSGKWLATSGTGHSDNAKGLIKTAEEFRIYHLPTGTLVHREQLAGLPLNKIAFSPTGQRLVATTYDGVVRWWDIEKK